VSFPDFPVCFLFDNGSLRAASTLNLRAVAKALAREIGGPMRAVSLLHSSGVSSEELGGERAQLLEPALQAWLVGEPAGEAVLLPLFFGPSAALTSYVPERMAALGGKFPKAKLELAHWLVDPTEGDRRIAEALAEAARAVIRSEQLREPRVVVVDHGSPQRAVTDVRNHLGAQVRAILRDEAAVTEVASMERRAGAEYAFADPLLGERLRTAPCDRGDVVLALQFLSPGRHAGAGGDIADICAAAKAERPELRTWMTDTIGTDARVVSVLAQRYREAAARLRAQRRQ
jgi:sirohydrochlorin ferrochelatase